MNTVDGKNFNPDGTVRTADFIACLGGVLGKLGLSKDSLPKPENPAKPITRQEAVKLVASSVLSPDDLTAIGNESGGASVYLHDFLDSADVAPWAEPYYAAAVYKGWISDRDRLEPKKPATRAFIAALLLHAISDSKHYTGLVVKVASSDLHPAQTMRIIMGDDESSEEILYPDKNHLPAVAVVGAPGIVSYSPSLDTAKARRVGENPMVVTATKVRIGLDNVPEIVISHDDGAAVRKADEDGFFLRTWRVAVVADTPPQSTDTVVAQQPSL
jgi:hypothetical protein